MDFLNVLERLMTRDAIVQYSPSWLRLDFSGHPVPKLLVIAQNIKKISYSYAMTA